MYRVVINPDSKCSIETQPDTRHMAVLGAVVGSITYVCIHTVCTCTKNEPPGWRVLTGTVRSTIILDGGMDIISFPDALYSRV